VTVTFALAQCNRSADGDALVQHLAALQQLSEGKWQQPDSGARRIDRHQRTRFQLFGAQREPVDKRRTAPRCAQTAGANLHDAGLGAAGRRKDVAEIEVVRKDDILVLACELHDFLIRRRPRAHRGQCTASWPAALRVST
jgi:hypothetical protein